MKKKFVRLISAVLSAAMTLTAVPLSAFAEGEAHTHDGESNVITTPLDFREKTADENGAGWSWDYDTKTLTLDGVNIQATTEENMMSVVTVPDGTEIVLNGNNTIVQTNTGDSDTYVLSAVNNKEVNCDGTMTISGDGVLNAENRSTDSMARSLGGSIILNGGTVNATGTVKTNSLEIHNDGVLNANATTASFEGVAVNVSGGITVDGNGSLTAVGCANESTLNSAILLTSNFGDKISVSENGSITVPEGNAARVGIYYSGNNGDGMDAEISGGKVTAYGAKYGIYKVNLIMSGTGSVYTTGGSYAIGLTVPTIDENRFTVKGSTEFKASESAVTGEVELPDGYYYIDGADAKTVVIKPDTSPRIILGKQTGIFKTEEYEIIEGMTDTKLKGTVYFDITLKNMSDEEFADARGYFGGDEPDLSASIIKTDYGWVCMVCDTEFSVTYDTDNTLTIKCGDIVSNTVQVKSNANRFNKVTQGDNTNRTVFYTNTSQEEKDNYKLVSTYTVDSESISYNWYSTNSAYSADELGAAVSGSNGEFKLADNIPAGNYVLYCDITYSDGDSTETVTEKFTFTYKECAHENGYSDGKCTNCGALCDHSNIDINTGKCNECEHQFVATISTDGNAPTGYDTLADCLNSITADTGNYVKIYQDIGDASATATLDTIDVKHNVMIDLNGHKLNNIKLEVNKDVTLTLTGTEGSYVDQVYVCKGGSFIIDSEANVEFDTIFAEAGTRFTVSDGANVTVRYLAVKESLSNEGNATSVKLATGMKITEMLAYDLDNSSPLSENIMLKNLLSDNQMLKYESSSKIINLYYGATRIIINSKTYGYGTITVVEHTDADHKYSSGTGKCEECGKPCEHGGDINTDTGICSICGAVVSVAIYTDANGISKYVDTDELHSLLNESGKSGTVKLFKDYYKLEQHDIDGVITIDLNGHDFTVRGVTPWSGGKVTFKNSGSEQVTCSGSVSPTVDAPGGTLIVDGDIYFDSAININDYGTVILNAGKYVDLTIKGDRTLYDMLGEGKAFFKADGTLFNASVKEISSSETLTVKDHSHTYVDGKCGCGYVCPHSDVDSETGKCTECEYQYAAVIVKDGAAASVYKETEMEAAFETADSEANTGCTLRVYKNYTGSYTTLSGKFTLWIAEKANVGTLTVSGDITVTGSGKNNRIYGDFNVAAGGKLTFDEKCGAMGTVSVGAGTFDCYSTFSITLNINDAGSDVILHGGAFKTICYNGGGDRANAEILTLLAENRMFMKSPNPEPIDGSKTLLKDGFATPVIVIPHEGHSYDSTTGKCTICGKRCGHTDVDSKTGVCSTCKYQLTAGISSAGTAKYFDNIDNAFSAALSAENSGCTLTLYKNCELSTSATISNATVTVDVNGYSLGGEADISVNDGGVLYLKDSRKSTYYGCIDAPFSVNGGTLINGTADGGSSAADVLNLVINSAKCVEIYGGIFENVYIAHASGVVLYGGRYNTICGEESNSTPVNTLLAKGYAFATLNSVTHLPESIVDGSAKTIGGRLTNVTVVKHTHTYNETNTKCACGAVLYAKVTSADGTTNEYFDSIEEGLLYADKAENKGCVFTLVTSGKINSEVTLSSGKFTIATATTNNNYVLGPYAGKITIDGADVIAEGDMFIRCKVNVKSGSLTLPEGSSAGFDSIAISGGTVTVSEGVNADSYVGADNLFVSEDATDAKLTIGGGTYGNVYLGQFKLKDVIASGVRVISYDNPTDPTAEKTAKALLYSDIAEKNNFDSENKTVSYYLFTKCEHKNKDGSYAFNEGGICKYCNSEFAASVSYTVDGSAKTELFSNICDAFDKANEIGTATVTLYKDITDSERTQEITVMGNVTLELNGKTLGGRYGIARISVSDGDTLTVNGDGDMDTPIYVNENSKLVINGGGYFNSVSVKKGGNAEIGGGTIRGLSVRGKVKLSGGKFNDIEIFNGNLESVLADGYAYKNADGTWLSIDEREKNSYLGGSKGALSVEGAPIKSASIAWYGGGTPVVYRNGAKNLDVNITYELADTSKQITYSDYVNGNNHSKDSEFSDNWYTVFGYEIGDIITEDGEVEYYTVLKCDGYEYKSNVLKLTLATCSHPEDSFTEKNNDGGVFCGICDLLIGAQVIKADGEPLGYADIESAIKLAQENEGSTVKLISEGVSTSNTSITVTGGKFTVDFNGKEVYYNSDVKGGDVTFTSSTEQADAENLLSTIKVNGADAKVTIDGKIKLGRVRTLSGTLTVNSTDGYIGELSIEGAKTDVDGARIGALRTFGGEAVIKNVTADSLAMFDNRSGGSEYNVSIVSGMFGSFTCENGSNYTLGRAIASGSVVSADSMNGITVYTYEAIQTMTSTYRIFVDKCSHKDKNGSYVLDGNPCPYCNEEIVATVSYTAGGSEETDLFTNIYDAFAKANEAGTATVTLQKNITDDITDTIAVTGNVTLELNGKRLSQPGTDVWYSIEVTSGKLTVNGSGLIKRVAVRNGGDAEINGGTFSDFIIKDGGNAVIKGGQFYSLQVSGEGRNVGQLLADGYAYWSFIDSGIWSTIAEREKQDITNVEVKEAPIKSASISWAGGEAPVIYRNGRKAASFAADVTYSGDKTLYITGCLIDGTVISEKTELLNGYCYLLGDQVDKVVAEDREIQYYCIFTYDGYDYKSNVVTLTVATCRHPGESVKCDDNGCVCGICNRALTASVELSDGTLSYYENWNDAIGAAEESEGCTLKLLDYSGVNDGEIFDISKGRFTVDLNKNDGTTTFAFDVKGGDITFTASQEASSSLTGVTVSGENANVLIDSKATLNYLVVNSGKVSADGANIGAITINGGDTVINDVNADYLSMKADTTGGSGYNVSIVSGTFNIFTCENESNYTLGRAIASGSRVIGLNAIVGSGFKYAEIQSMTKANYLNVIKCDHKDENDSYALDGNLCPYCNEEIAATVSYTADGSEQTDLFSDIYDAFDKANEAGTATVTLYKDITNSELTQGVTITGNVTLALNGKKLGGTFAFNAPVEVSDGGMFTVGGDGKMRMPIKAYANSKLIINGGEFTSVMVYIDGDAEIGGGVIDALTIIGNAKAKISGGKFYNIEIANGSLESVLADGYAYKKDGGAWLSIAERAESVYSSVNNDNKPVNVEEAPIKSATLSTEMNKLYRNSNANPTLKFNLSLANGSNLNDSYVSKRYGINSYVSGDIIYSSLSALVKDAKLSADEIIDKAGDSDVAEIYFVVTTGDGYEIKSNTVSIDLVDCDHSQVVDPTADKETAGNITEPTYCEICESKFNAKITKGDDVRYYNNLDEAAKDAQKSENEGCTLYPLYNKNGYGGQLVITEGNFTLKYAVRTAFSRPIIINGKAKLTVTGRCAVTAFENQDAFIVQGGDVTFDGLATGSNVTINGGNVTMAANNINCLTINGGNVSISSGGFAEIVTTVSDKVIADYIDHGFWVQDRETKEWIDIYSLNKATASSTNGLTVRLCPMQIIKPIDTVYYTNGYYPDGIPSLQINAEPWYSNEVDAKVAYQWIAIDENGYETVIEGATDRKLSLENLTTGRYYCRLTYSNATTAGVSMKSDVVTATITECEHSGGEATCTEKAKCEICGAEYGEPLGHDYVVIKVVEPDYRNEGYSVFECTRCKDSYIGNRVPVKPIPDVEEIAVEKTTYNEVDISWKNISGVDGYYVECYVGNQWKQIGFSTDGDRVAAKLSGLSAGLKYKVRIAAYAGRFTAKFRCFYVDTVPSPVWNINTVKATDETVRISWSRNARADGYKVEWYINNQWSVKTVTGNNNISAVIDGLCAGTRYKVRVSAYKGDLYSPYTYGYIDTLPSKVTGITQKVTSSSFTLKWDKNESADGYTVQYYADGKWNEKTLTGNKKTTVTIGSLKGYKTYKVRIKAYKGELESAFDDIYITTAPTKVSGLKVKSAVDSKAVVIWNADANADGYNVGYYIGGRWVEKTITDNKTAMAVLGGLTPYSTCKVRVRAYKDNLYGDYSYTTVTAVLSPVTNIKVVSAKSNSITVKWGKNASADGYKVEIYKGGKWVKKTLKGSTNATVTIGGLRAGSVYKVRIASYKGANTSTYTYANVKTAK